MLRKNKFKVMLMTMMGVVLLAGQSWSDQVNFASSQSSSQLLQIPLGARGAGLGDAMAAAGQGVEAMNWNPAGLLSGYAHQVLTDYVALPGGINVATLAYAYNQPWWGGGLWLSYVNYGQIEKLGLTANGFPIRDGETFTPSSMLGIASLAAELQPGITAGISGKFLYEDMVAKSWSVISTDLGLLLDTAFPDLQAGFVVKNIGQNVGQYAPPLTAQMGLVWQNGVGLFSKDNLRISVDSVLTEAQSLQVAAGVEFEMEEMVTLRFGYHSNELQDTGDIMRGFSGGLSLRYADYALHYAFTPNSTIGASHRLTLEAAFGRTAEAENSSTSGRESGSQSQGSQYLLKYLK